MSTKLRATVVSAENDGELIAVGFADKEFDTKEYLQLTCSLSSDEQDRLLGHDQIYMEYCDQSRAVYGGLLQCAVGATSVWLTLTPNAAKRLRTETSIEITFAGDARRVESVRRYLVQMLSGRVAFTLADPPASQNL